MQPRQLYWMRDFTEGNLLLSRLTSKEARLWTLWPLRLGDRCLFFDETGSGRVETNKGAFMICFLRLSLFALAWPCGKNFSADPFDVVQ